MKKYSIELKEKMMKIFQKMARNQEAFIQNPEKDFTRKRKLDFATMMTLLLAMNGGSILSELLEFLRLRHLLGSLY